MHLGANKRLNLANARDVKENFVFLSRKVALKMLTCHAIDVDILVNFIQVESILSFTVQLNPKKKLFWLRCGVGKGQRNNL